MSLSTPSVWAYLTDSNGMTDVRSDSPKCSGASTPIPTKGLGRRAGQDRGRIGRSSAGALCCVMDQLFRADWVRRAYALLAAYEPRHYNHVMRVFSGWQWSPTDCEPNAWACTGPAPGLLRFRKDPLEMSIHQLTGMIAHESMHWTPTLQLVQHRCRHRLCSDPADRLRDPIYREHEAVVTRLRARTPDLRFVRPVWRVAA